MLGVISNPANVTVVLAKSNLSGVQYDAILATDVKPCSSLEECLLNRVRPHQGVVNAFGFLRDVRDDLVKSATVAVTRGDVSLGSHAVPISTPRGDEGGKVAVIFMEVNAVVPVPSVKHGLSGVGWDSTGLVERGLGMVCLADSVSIERLKVYCSSWLARLFGAYHHFVAPGHRSANGDWLDDSKADISVEARFHIVLPVHRYWDRCVVGNGFGVVVYHESDWWS